MIRTSLVQRYVAEEVAVIVPRLNTAKITYIHLSIKKRVSGDCLRVLGIEETCINVGNIDLLLALITSDCFFGSD